MSDSTGWVGWLFLPADRRWYELTRRDSEEACLRAATALLALVPPTPSTLAVRPAGDGPPESA